VERGLGVVCGLWFGGSADGWICFGLVDLIVQAYHDAGRLFRVRLSPKPADQS